MLTLALCFLALLAPSHAAVCGDITNQDGKCTKMGKKLGMANPQGPDGLSKMCRILKEYLQCFDPAMANCKASGLDKSIPKGVLESMKANRGLMDSTCQDSGMEGGSAGTGATAGKIPENPTCHQNHLCIAGTSNMLQLAQQNKMVELCLLSKKMNECTRKALKDCKTNKVLPEEQLKQMRKSYQKSIDEHDKKCAGYETSGSSGNTNGGDGSNSETVNINSENTGTEEGVTKDSNVGGKIPQTAGCSESARKCTPSEGTNTEDCSVAKGLKDCLKSALDVCKKDKNNLQAIVEGVEKTYKMASDVYKEKCPGGASAITQTTLFLSVFSAMSLIVTRLL